MVGLHRRLSRLFPGKKGQALVEYGMLLALITLALILAITTMGQSLLSFINNFTGYITSLFA